MKIDNGVVDYGVRLWEFKHWRLRAGKDMPFYINTGENSLLFDGKPETVRDLWKIYNIHKFSTFIEFVSFLNEEGVSARKISAPVDRILGYPIALSNN